MRSDNVNLHLSLTVPRSSLAQAAELLAMGLQTAAVSVPGLVSAAVSLYDEDELAEEEADEPNLDVHIAGTGDLDMAGAVELAKVQFGRRDGDA